MKKQESPGFSRGEQVKVVSVEKRCDRSDLPASMCAHCVGHAGVPSIDVAPTPPVRAPRLRVVRDPEVPVRRAEQPPATSVRVEYPVLCASGRCRPDEHGGPRETGGRSHVCPVCEDRTRENLDALAAAWPDLQKRLTALRSPWGSEPVTGGGSTGIDLDERVSGTAHAAAELVAFYSRLVIAERGHTPPAASPPSLARWLARSQTPWLCAHSDQGVAASYVGDVADAWRDVRAAAYPVGTKTIRLPLRCSKLCPVPHEDGSMPEPDEDGQWPDGTRFIPCPGGMTATIHPDLQYVPDLVCDLNPGHRVPPAEWQRTGWKAAAKNQAATLRLLQVVDTPGLVDRSSLRVDT